MAAEIARDHHERFDGTGYHARKSGNASPLSARMDARGGAQPNPYQYGYCEDIRENNNVKFHKRLEHALNESNVSSEDSLAIAEALQDLVDRELGKGLEIGEKAPDFCLPSAAGKQVCLRDLLGVGPVVISFYRGDWCPFCNLEMEAQEEIFDHVRSAGGTLIAIGPQSREHAQKLVDRFHLTFDLLLDTDQRVAEAYRLRFEVPKALTNVHRKLGIDLTEENANGAVQLPVPATYVLDAGGVVRAAYASLEWWKRMDPLDIYEVVHSMAYFESAFRNAPNGIVILDADGALRTANHTMHTHFREVLTLLSGGSFFQAARFRNEGVGEKQQRLLAGTLESAEFRWVSLEEFDLSETCIVDVILSPFRIGRQISGLVCTIADVTEQAAQYARLDETFHALEDVNSHLNRLLATIGHDLRSPIGGVRQLTQMLKRDYANMEGEELGEILGEIERAADGSLNLLEELLQWAHMHADDPAPKLRSFAVDELIQAEVDLLGETARSKGIEIQRLTADAALVCADRNMIAVVIRNLLTNALKFTPTGGSVTVGAAFHDDERRRVSVFVSDTGVGMNQETIAKVFHPEERYTTRGTDNEKGTGLGLTLCSELLIKHGTELAINSAPGKGTTSSFVLPTDRGDECGRGADQPPQGDKHE